MKSKRYNRKKHTKGWTKERRLKQSQRCKQNKPWQHSTGPKTMEGKQAISQNAYKHGMRNAAIRNLLKAMAAQNRFVTRLMQRENLKINWSKMTVTKGK